MKRFPLTLDEYLQAVAQETARMSWPGQMQAILKAETKKSVECFFTTLFQPHLQQVWTDARQISVEGYEDWHEQRTQELGHFLRNGKHVKKVTGDGQPTNYREIAVACKLLNTFMHQLMKYEPCRLLWTRLHLVFDSQIFKAMLALKSPALDPVKPILRQKPYTILYQDYQNVQGQLWLLISELNVPVQVSNLRKYGSWDM